MVIFFKIFANFLEYACSKLKFVFDFNSNPDNPQNQIFISKVTYFPNKMDKNENCKTDILFFFNTSVKLNN